MPATVLSKVFLNQERNLKSTKEKKRDVTEVKIISLQLKISNTKRPSAKKNVFKSKLVIKEKKVQFVDIA